jgi:hypothetical protein
MKPTIRPLTAAEKKFVKEAEELSFDVCYQDDGTPYAMGATENGHGFSMLVLENEEPDGESSCYYLG